MTGRVRAAALGAALTMIAGPAAAQGTRAGDPLDRLFAAVDRPDTPGCAVDVRRGGRVLARRAYGQADLERPAPNRVDTLFEAGSVSKQVTAALVAILAERGTLATGDSVRRWLPELPDAYQPVTIAMLLDHSAGVRDWGSLADLTGWSRGSRAYAMGDVLMMLRRQRELNAPAGSEFIYSNGNYVLAALVVERASGATLQAFAQAALFAPLGMAATRWRDDHRGVVPGRALAYLPGAGGAWSQGTPFEDVVGPGGLLTTVGDLQRFTAALDAGVLPWTRRMGRPMPLAGRAMSTYATGLFLNPVNGHAAISHGGATGGYRAWAGRFPEDRLSVALLCNAGSLNTEDLGPAVAAVFLPPRPQPTAAGVPGPADAPTRPYRNVADDGVAQVREADGRYVVEGRVREVRRLPDGRLLVTRAGNAPAILAPAAAWSPDRAVLAAVAGRYRSDEAEGDIVLAMDGDRLAWVDPRGDRVALDPTVTDTLTGWDWQLRLVRDRRGRATGLRASSDRVRGLVFRRVAD